MDKKRIDLIYKQLSRIIEFAKLKKEYGSNEVETIFDEVEKVLKNLTTKTIELSEDLNQKANEPDDLTEIRRLRIDGPRKLWNSLDKKLYVEKLEGALLSRFAGCTLGAYVEGWSIEDMSKWAEYIGDAFPFVDYLSKVKDPTLLRYWAPCSIFSKSGMDSVPPDDDIMYTLLGLLIVEEYGLNFTTDDIGKAWLKYLPVACTAEEIALENLRNGISPRNAAEIDNPYCQLIGATIRSDPFAYIAAGYPEKAAELAYKDAYISHRRNGIYGEMFFAATQSAAFAVDNAIDAIKIGLTEIPKQCALYKDITWALETGKKIKNYKEARYAVDERFPSMSTVHTNNNACLTIFGLMIGGNDVTKVISETVAMGLDNDCTAATAGSIVGAIVGKKGVPAHWYKNFNNKVKSYLINQPLFYIDDLVNRFVKQAEKIW